jgi:hypothetical protein
MKKFMLSVALVAMSALAWALPSLQDVEAQVSQGHYAQAESMMKEVVAAKPNSARAHYVYAEILAHDGNLARAADEARLARQIDPDIGFTSPEKFRSFEASLTRAQNPASRLSATPSAATPTAPAAAAPAAAAGLPSWVWLAGLAAVAFFLWRGFSRSAAGAAGGAAAGPGATFGGTTAVAPNAMAPGAMPYGAGYPAQRPSSGLMGVGLGVAGGVAAGMLADELLHRNRDGNAVDHGGSNVQPGFFDSPSSGSAASDLADRPIDFGTGGNDWDSGSVDVGGGSDSGGGWD